MQRLFCVIILFCCSLAFPAYKYKKNNDDNKTEKPLPVTQEYLTTAAKQFRAGAQFYGAGNVEKALPIFTKTIRKFGKSPVAEESSILAAQCHLRLENYEEARWILRYFPRRYPRSPYLTRCAYLTGILLAAGGDA